MPNNKHIQLYDEADEKRIHHLILQWEQKRLIAVKADEKKLSENIWLWFQPSPDEKDQKLYAHINSDSRQRTPN